MNYTISFFINGYGQQPDDITNTNVIHELPVLAEDGFSFEGWYLDEDLTVEAIVGTSIESDIVLYASWSRQRGGWGPQTATDGASTYAAPRPGIDIVGPGIDDGGGGTDIGGGGGGETITDFPTVPTAKSLSCFTGASGYGLTNKVAKNGLDYNAGWPTTTYSNFSVDGESLKLLTSSTRDPWNIVATMSGYYNNSTSAITTIEAGTKPQFFTRFLDVDLSSKAVASSGDTHWQYDIYWTPTALKLTSTLSGSSSTTTYYASQFYDGAIPKRILAVMQGAGGGGGNGGKASNYSWGSAGTGGGAGGFMVAVLNLYNDVAKNSSLYNSYPVLKFFVPRRAPSATNGGDCYVQYPVVNGSTVTYTTIITAGGGGAGKTGSGSVDYASRGYVTLNESYKNTGYWLIKYAERYDNSGELKSSTTPYEFTGMSGNSGLAKAGNGAYGGGNWNGTSFNYFSVNGYCFYNTSKDSYCLTDPKYVRRGNPLGLRYDGRGDYNNGWSGCSGGGASLFANGGRSGLSLGDAGGDALWGAGGGGGAGGPTKKGAGGAGGYGGNGMLELWY